MHCCHGYPDLAQHSLPIQMTHLRVRQTENFLSITQSTAVARNTSNGIEFIRRCISQRKVNTVVLVIFIIFIGRGIKSPVLFRLPLKLADSSLYWLSLYLIWLYPR